MKINNRAFTLVELLVVILIIGILAAIAVPQYKKAVLKANLHKGMPLVENLYQAQQAYVLTHGDFATDIDALDITIPKDESCTKSQTERSSSYTCDFGKVGMWDFFANIQYIEPNGNLAYLHYIQDDHREEYNFNMNAGEVWCYAAPKNKTAQDICVGMGGSLESDDYSWKRYKIR